MIALSARNLLLAASRVQEDAKRIGFGPTLGETDPNSLYDQLVTHPVIREATHGLFTDGYYALAVEECYKCINNSVKSKCRSSLDGSKFMQHVFSANQPLLALSDLKSISKKDEQLGYMQILAGCMTGIRNPRAHEHNFFDHPDVAMELLYFGNHLRGPDKTR